MTLFLNSPILTVVQTPKTQYGSGSVQMNCLSQHRWQMLQRPSSDLKSIKSHLNYLGFASWGKCASFSIKSLAFSANYCGSCCTWHRTQLGQCKIRSPLSAKQKRLKCPGRETLLIRFTSPKVTGWWKSRIRGCFSSTLTQLNCPFISFKEKNAASALRLTSWHSASEGWKWCWWDVAFVYWPQERDTDFSLLVTLPWARVRQA